MHLLTVTCNRDLPQMILQAESISKFLEPCKHYVIVNEKYDDLTFWYKWLKPYYTNHELKLLNPIPVDLDPKIESLLQINNSYGWRMQQLQKILFSFHTNEDYLILDTKNFFINKCNINEYDSILGGRFTNLNEDIHFSKTSEYYADFFNVKPRDKGFAANTPFKIEKDLITSSPFFDFYSLPDALLYPQLFGSDSSTMSEFIFYTYLVDQNHQVWQNLNDIKSWVFWDMGEYDNNFTLLMKKFLEITKDSEKYKISGFHRTILRELKPSHFLIINKFLNSLGFKNKIYPLPPSID